MRDSLIELLENVHYAQNDAPYQHISHIEELADYLLANGVIVAPCKVGDKVWFVERRFHYKLKTFKEYVCEGYVKAIKISMKPMKITIEYPIADDPKGRCKGADWSATSIGKTVFLTKEEADKALRKKDEHK